MKTGRRSFRGFLEESSGCRGSSLSSLGICPSTSCLGVTQVSPLTLLTQWGACFLPLTLPDSNPHQPVPLGWPPWQKGDKRMHLWRVRSLSQNPKPPWDHMRQWPRILTSSYRPCFLSPLTAGVLVGVTKQAHGSSVLSHRLEQASSPLSPTHTSPRTAGTSLRHGTSPSGVPPAVPTPTSSPPPLGSSNPGSTSSLLLSKPLSPFKVHFVFHLHDTPKLPLILLRSVACVVYHQHPTCAHELYS